MARLLALRRVLPMAAAVGWRQIRRRLSHGLVFELILVARGGDCAGRRPLGRPERFSADMRSQIRCARPPPLSQPTAALNKETPYANPPHVFSTTNRMAWLYVSVSSSTTFDRQVQEDLVRARLVCHRSRRSAASRRAVKQLHALRISDLSCDRMCEACVALSDGKGLRESSDMGALLQTYLRFRQDSVMTKLNINKRSTSSIPACHLPGT